MKKNSYKLDNIHCAACGVKMEENVNKLDGVLSSNFNFVFLKFNVEFNEELITDEKIELTIHESVSGVRIIGKNNKEFIDEYEEPKVFKKILFGGRKKGYEKKNIWKN